MQLASYRTSRGFSIFELIVAMGLATVILGGALALTSQAIGLSDMVSQRSDMQQNGRVAINMMALDASLAGTGFPTSGVQLPSGNGSQPSYFACDSAGCYVTNNVYSAERLYATWPGQAGGPTINGVATDVLTVVYDDPTSEFDQYVLTDIDPLGKDITFDAATTPAYDDAVVGLKVGDVLLLSNVNGQAVGEITDVSCAGGDACFSPGVGNGELRFNQSGAAVGSIKQMIHPPDGAAFAPTTARRIYIITYYINNSDPDIPLLMRQVNASPPMAVAEYVENLQVTYDIYDDNTSVATADLDDAGGQPNQIRKTNIAITVRSPGQTMIEQDFQRRCNSSRSSASTCRRQLLASAGSRGKSQSTPSLPGAGAT